MKPLLFSILFYLYSTNAAVAQIDSGIQIISSFIFSLKLQRLHRAKFLFNPLGLRKTFKSKFFSCHFTMLRKPLRELLITHGHKK